MKLVGLTLFGVVGLSGCGTLPAPGAMPATTAAAPTESAIDHARMNLIDQAARRRGVQVVWVTPPRKMIAGGG